MGDRYPSIRHITIFNPIRSFVKRELIDNKPPLNTFISANELVDYLNDRILDNVNKNKSYVPLPRRPSIAQELNDECN